MIPMVVGAVPFGIIFGALAVSAGLSPGMAMAMSLLVFGGASQFVAIGLVTQGVGVLLIILTTFVLNVRHALYAASLAPYVKRLPQRWLLPVGFLLTDEAYAVTIARYRASDTSACKHWYYLGAAMFMYVSWQLSTLLGVLAGNQLKQMGEWGLEFAMVATFMGIAVPMLVTPGMLLCGMVSGAVALIFYDLPHQLGLILATCSGIVAGVWAGYCYPVPVKKEEHL